ncbi:MAG: ATP-binding protein [Flavobacteriaceae bacterium]|nr:ATP-binding protein [Flavobacteriaceae bacterium]
MEKALTQHPSNCLKFVLFGPESTGKTTLAKQLAAYYKTEWVPEYMREYLEEKWRSKKEKITKDDIFPIALGQIHSENKLTKTAETFLFCDTNLLEIKVYCDYYYENFCPNSILEATERHQYHHYFLTAIDVPWQPDILRDRPYDRSTLFCMFEAELKKNNLPFTILSGNEKQRFNKAKKVVDNLKRNRYAY